MKKGIITVVSILLFVVVTARAEPVRDLKSAPPEVQLACLNVYNKSTSNPDPAKVTRFKYLLGSLKSHYPESKKEIADWTVKAQGAMKEKGVKEDLLDIMESVNKVKISKSLGVVPYKDCLVAYSMLRTEGMSREEAAMGITQILKGVAQSKK